jgi:hypothetical protein
MLKETLKRRARDGRRLRLDAMALANAYEGEALP